MSLQQPLLHAIIALLQITMVSILVRKFNAYYTNRPILTTMITNAVRQNDISTQWEEQQADTNIRFLVA